MKCFLHCSTFNIEMCAKKKLHVQQNFPELLVMLTCLQYLTKNNNQVRESEFILLISNMSGVNITGCKFPKLIYPHLLTELLHKDYTSFVGICGPVGRAEDQRSEGLGFDSWPGLWTGALVKLLESHTLLFCIVVRTDCQSIQFRFRLRFVI